MPTYDGLGFDDDERISPVGPKAPRCEPESPVDGADVEPAPLRLEGGQLLSKYEVLGDIGSGSREAPKKGLQCAQCQSEPGPGGS